MQVILNQIEDYIKTEENLKKKVIYHHLLNQFQIIYHVHQINHKRHLKFRKIKKNILNII